MEFPKGFGLLTLLETQPGACGTNSYLSRAGQHALPDELHGLVARNPLEGLLAQRLGCLRCGYVGGLSFTPFKCLTVTLGQQPLYDITSCLNDFTMPEHIDGIYCPRCTISQRRKGLEAKIRELEKKNQSERASADLNRTTYDGDPSTRQELRDCLGQWALAEDAMLSPDFSDALLPKCGITVGAKILVEKTKQTVIARAPKSLVIHISRSEFNMFSKQPRKNKAAVSYPMVLDLSSWCLGWDLLPDHDGPEMKKLRDNPKVPMLSPDARGNSRDSQPLYRLRAVITHAGDKHERGHYICYRKYPTRSLDDGKDTKSAGTYPLLAQLSVSFVPRPCKD